MVGGGWKITKRKHSGKEGFLADQPDRIPADSGQERSDITWGIVGDDGGAQ